MSERLIGLLLRFRLPILLVIAVSVCISGYYITTIRVDNDTLKAIPATIKPRVDYDQLKKEFPAPFNILLLAEFTGGSLTEKIDSLRSWSQQFGSLKGISGVTDLTNLQVPVRRGFLGLSSSPVVPPPGDTLNELKVRKLINQNRSFSRLFISEDETMLGMVTALEWNADRTAILDSMFSKLRKINTSDHIQVYLTSEGAVSYFIDKSMKRDFRLLLPVCFILIFFLLYRVFRRMLYVVASLAVVAVALLWTFGIMGALGIPFSIVASIIPVIIFPIGVADAIHLIRTYSYERRVQGSDVRNALGTTYRELLTPCLLTSLTTFAGFASFTLSTISWNRIFGLFTGIAVLLCYFFNVVLLPLFLSFEKRSAVPATGNESREEKTLTRFWDLFISFSLKSKRWILLLPLLCAIMIYGVMNSRFENNFMMMLPPNNQLRQSDSFISRHFGGTRFFSIVLRQSDTTITSVEEWEQISGFATWLTSQSGVGNVMSLMPLINRVSTMLSKKQVSKAAVSLITANDGLFGKSFNTYISNYLSTDRRTTRIQVTCPNDKSVSVLEIARHIESHVKETMPGYTVLVSGPSILSEAMSAVLVNTLIISLIATLIPIFFCLVAFFRSPRIGIYCILPIGLLVAIVYALMGTFNVSINLITVIILNTCIGIGIDYAIHFVSGYRYIRPLSASTFEALITTIQQKGTPILFNTIVVGIGFCVLFFSSFPPIRDFGLVVFISMFVAAGFSILIISLLIHYFGLAVSPVRKESP